MPHLPPGSSGVLVGIAVLFVAAWTASSATGKFSSFDFDARGEKGAFEKLLPIYLRVAEIVISLAAGSIVLLVGSSAFRATERLPWHFASPLVLLAVSIIYGILFMVFLITDYEAYRHQSSGNYTRFKYTRNQALGYGGLICFCIGHIWLIAIVTR